MIIKSCDISKVEILFTERIQFYAMVGEKKFVRHYKYLGIAQVINC